MFLPVFVEEGDYILMHKPGDLTEPGKALRMRMKEIDHSTGEVTVEHVDEGGRVLGEQETTLKKLARFIKISDRFEWDTEKPHRENDINTSQFEVGDN